MLANALGSSPSGRYSAAGVRNIKIEALLMATTAITMMRLIRPPISQPMTRSIKLLQAGGFCPTSLWEVCSPKLADAVGTRVIATSIEARIEADTAMATSEYS